MWEGARVRWDSVGGEGEKASGRFGDGVVEEE